VAKVGTFNPDRTISLKRLQCVVVKINIKNRDPAVDSNQFLALMNRLTRLQESICQKGHAVRTKIMLFDEGMERYYMARVMDLEMVRIEGGTARG
jgi:hypothetical protein